MWEVAVSTFFFFSTPNCYLIFSTSLIWHHHLPQMEQLKASKMRVFGLFAVIGDARCIAAAASKAGLLGEGYLWFGTSPSLTDVSGWQDAAGNVVPEYYKLFQARFGGFGHASQSIGVGQERNMLRALWHLVDCHRNLYYVFKPMRTCCLTPPLFLLFSSCQLSTASAHTELQNFIGTVSTVDYKSPRYAAFAAAYSGV
jgi:hypothetical protein